MEAYNSQGFSFDLPKGNSSIIKVIGVGGGGNNALKHMYEKGIHGVDFVICNTDAQTLDNNPVANKVQLGITMTEGLGAGADPEVGEKAAIESIDDIKASLGQNTKMVFITAGMGGGTGTGAAPVIAKVAKEMGILTVGIVTVPFSFEGRRRLDQAEIGLEKLRNNVDSLIVINNDKLRQQFGNLGFKQGFSKADEVLTNAAKGMAEVITGYFDVNIDFRDAKSVLQNSGTALMSTGSASGENKAEEAVRKALDSPLLNDNKITGARNVLLLIRSGNEEATMDEIGVINDYIQKEAGNTADIIFGVGSDEELGDAISVLVIATGFSKDNLKHSGPTEKISYSLTDKVEREQRESPFKTKAERTEEQAPQESASQQKNFFRLDAEDDMEGFNFNNKQEITGTAQTAYQAEELAIEVEVAEEYNDGDHNDDYYSYNDFDEDFDSDSFSFEVENRPTNNLTNDTEASAAAQEITFTINTPTEAPTNFQVKEEVSEVKQSFTNQVEEVETKSEVRNVFNFTIEEPVFQVQKAEEVKPVIEEEVVAITETVVETPTEEFTFIPKQPSVQEQKAQERRNKLKEFNSRYQVIDNEKEFETIPAFKRKNINLEINNVSEQQNNYFMSENERGDIQIRENRFLNKDVD